MTWFKHVGPYGGQ